MDQDTLFNAGSTKSLTPATEGGSAWGNIGSALEKVAGLSLEIYKAEKSSDLSEKQLDAQAAIARSQIASTKQLETKSGMGMSENTRKLIIGGVIAAVVVIGAALAIRAARK